MAEFADIVRAPPETVWRALIDVGRRGEWPRLYTSARQEEGQPGSLGSVALYETRRTRWREGVLESDAPQRLRLEVRDAADGRAVATLEWRLRPIQLGTLLVLRVRSNAWFQRLGDRAWRARRHRRLLEALKRSVEAGPTQPERPAAAETSVPPPAGETTARRAPARRSRVQGGANRKMAPPP